MSHYQFPNEETKAIFQIHLSLHCFMLHRIHRKRFSFHLHIFQKITLKKKNKKLLYLLICLHIYFGQAAGKKIEFQITEDTLIR